MVGLLHGARLRLERPIPVGSRSEEEDLDAVNRLRDAFHLPWFRIID